MSEPEHLSKFGKFFYDNFQTYCMERNLLSKPTIDKIVKELDQKKIFDYMKRKSCNLNYWSDLELADACTITFRTISVLRSFDSWMISTGKYTDAGYKIF